MKHEYMIDQPALRTYLADAFSISQKDVRFERFSGGQSSPTFKVLSGDKALCVLRKKPRGVLLPSAHAIDREYRIQTALRESGVPVPNMLMSCDDNTVLPEPFYLMEYVDGRVFADVKLPEVSPHERRDLYAGMIQNLAALHQLDWRALGLEDFGRPETYIERQIVRWSKQFASFGFDGDLELMTKLGVWLSDHLPKEMHSAIVHGDYRLGNLMFEKEGSSVRAVLDWELSTIGHPWVDLAFCCHFYMLRQEEGGPHFSLLPLPKGIPSQEDFVTEYCRLVDLDDIPHWPYYLVFVLFRSAATLAGIYHRALQGNAAGEDARDVGGRFRDIANRAWVLAQTSGL